MTKDEFIKIYGTRVVEFSSFYEFRFNYRYDNMDVTFGGTSDIYMMALDRIMSVGDLINMENVVVKRNGKVIYVGK